MERKNARSCFCRWALCLLGLILPASSLAQLVPAGPELQAMPLEERLTHRIDTERLTTDLQLGADLVQERSGASRAAVLGFCMGGMNVFRAAGTGRFDRGVAFYGMIRPPEPSIS